MVCNLVHGILHATIFEAKALGEIQDILHGGKGHTKFYATISFEEARVAETCVVEHEADNPVWNQSFRIHCAYSAPFVVISLKNNLPVGAAVVGRARIPVDEILSGNVVEGWYALYNDDDHHHEKNSKRAEIRIRLQFVNVTKGLYWGAGLRDGNFAGVPFTYFKQRTGCNVTLYQNSHVSNNFKPPIYVDGRPGLYRPARLWEDIYKAIDGAKHVVYITGWSVNANITLVRDEERMIDGAQGVTLGELLKRKANEGVTVLLLIWDDRTSVPFLRNNGVMRTHDQETYEYFKHTNIQCCLCPRVPDSSLGPIQHLEVETLFTHHQKTITVDVPLIKAGFSSSTGSFTRTLVSFVGGIDLCDGRYDTEAHYLFRTLDTLHKDDYYNTNFPGAELRHGGPRQPWHDVHSKLEGMAAWDVLTNFEQRWRKQADSSLLAPIDQIMSPTTFSDEERWNVQVFRSIDKASVIGFPAKPAAADKLGLSNGKYEVIDRSIQTAYIEAIRRAKKFIYIENQYFMGSCASWDKDTDCECLHLIPIEIALKIVSKIRARERFAVYIVIPMWPEGTPEDGSVQAILHWNRRTIDMMYNVIGEALAEEGMEDAVPTDYLNFFCLGNRETRSADEYLPPESPQTWTDYWNAQMHRRFMIYVHSKLMIVDDEYIIVGSANLNQRSMDGGRDTEIAQGSFQPHHINKKGSPARGQIYGFRMSLWYEHIGSVEDCFVEAESLQCVRRIRSMSEQHWNDYVGEEVVDMVGHLVPFPIRVLKDGCVEDLEGYQTFPDTTALVRGQKSSVLPPILTT